MEMKGQDERRFAVKISHVDGYKFSNQASEDGRLHGEPFLSEEPDPVGEASAPSTPALFGAALGHCLSAALLEALRKARVDVLDSETETLVVVKPNDEGNPRIERVDVTISPRIGARSPLTQRCADVFENHCTVTASVKRGVQVNVGIDWQVAGEERSVARSA